MNKIVLHIGLCKTGSTFLQEELFPNLIHTDLKLNPNIYMEFNNRLNYINDLTLYKKERYKINVQKENFKYLKRFIKVKFFMKEKSVLRKDKTTIYSSEGLVGSGLRPSKNSFINALVLKILFPKAKIILVLRRQEDYLKSIYRQLVFKEDRYDRFIPFKEIVDFSQDYLDWFKIVTVYKFFFGEKKLLVLPYELMKIDLEKFTKKITKFLDVTPDLPNDYYKKKVNVSSVLKYKDSYNFFEDEIRSHSFQEFYKTKNFKLDKLTGENFREEYNY